MVTKKAHDAAFAANTYASDAHHTLVCPPVKHTRAGYLSALRDMFHLFEIFLNVIAGFYLLRAAQKR